MISTVNSLTSINEIRDTVAPITFLIPISFVLCSAINADSYLIEQVLINLIKNSIQALDQTEKKKLQIIVDSTPSYQIIEVIDNGCGIEENDLDEIFVPFYSTRENGSGIGLSLSKQIMLRHGGNIKASSKPGMKTCFSLLFPLNDL